MDTFIVIGIFFLGVFAVVGLVLSLLDEDLTWLIGLTFVGVLFFAMSLAYHFDVKNDAKNYQENLQNLNNRIIIINSLDTIEEKTNESIQLITEYIENYNNYLKKAIDNTEQYYPELLNKYQNYYYFDYDYVSNSVVKIPLN